MNVNELKVFVAVARLGGMTAAAAELNMVQSNVTARIKQLEDGIGVPLFERLSRGVCLSPAGRRLLPLAKRILLLLEDAHAAARDDGTPQGTLRLGSLETVTAMHLSAIAARYLAEYPAVDLALMTGTSQDLVQAVLNRDVDGAFVCGPLNHPDLDAVEVFREELVLVTPPGWTAAASLGGADARAVVLKAGCSYRQRLEEVLHRRGVTSIRLLELGTIEGIVGMVAAGQGVTLLPRRLMAGAYGRAAVEICALPPKDAAVKTLFVRRNDVYVSSALQAFLAGLDALEIDHKV